MGAAEAAAILAPVLLPFARRAATEARNQLADRLGGETADAVGGLWARLRDRLGGGEETEAQMEKDVTAALSEDPALLEEARSVVNLVVEGDRNVVQQGDTNINVSGGNNINIGRL